MANWWDEYAAPSNPPKGNWWDQYVSQPDFSNVQAGEGTTAPRPLLQSMAPTADPEASTLGAAWRANMAQMGPIFAGNVKRMAAETADPIAGLLNGTFGKPQAEESPTLALNVNPNAAHALPPQTTIATPEDAGQRLMDEAKREPLRNETLRNLQQSGIEQAQRGGQELAQAQADLQIPESGAERYLKLGAMSAGPTLAGLAAGAVTKSPTIGAGVSTMFAVPSAYGEARDAGHSVEDAIKYAGVVGGAEAISERLGFDAILGKLAQRIPAGKLATAIGFLEKSIPGRVLTGAGVEGTTEALSQVAQDAYKVAGLGDHMSLDEFKTDVMDSFGAGAVIGGPLSGGVRVGERISEYDPNARRQQQAQNLIGGLEQSAQRLRTPESDAVDAGREAARAIFAEAGADQGPELIRPGSSRPLPPEALTPISKNPQARIAELEAKPEPTLFEREELALLKDQAQKAERNSPDFIPERKTADSVPDRNVAEISPRPAAETVAGEPELIRNGTRVFYPGDVKVMRAKLAEAGLSEGMRKTGENGEDAGLYFPAKMQAQVDAVLRPRAQETAAPEPTQAPAEPYQGPTIPPPRKQRNQVRSAADFDPNYHDVRDFIALNGGLDASKFNAEFGSEVPTPAENVRFFGKPLFRKKGGMSPDKLRERLQEAGFLNEDSPDAPARYTPQDAYDLVDRAMAGEPVYHPDGVDVQNAIRADQDYYAELSKRQEYIDENGVTPELDAEFAQRAAALERGDLEPVYSKRTENKAQTGLFAEPTAAERIKGAEAEKDAQRNGLGRDLVQPSQGPGDLFAGQRPKQEVLKSKRTDANGNEESPEPARKPPEDVPEQPTSEGIESSEIPADEAEKIIADLRKRQQARLDEKADPLTEGFKILGSNKDAFRNKLLPGKTMSTLAEQAGDTVYARREMDGNDAVHVFKVDQGKEGTGEAKVYDNGEDVWIDVSGLKSGGGAGERIYNLAYSFAKNNGRNFKEDPSGLSDTAVQRRPVQQLAAILKSGTAEPIEPGDFLGTPRPKEAPQTRPIQYDPKRGFEPTLREHVLTVYDNTSKAVPEIKGISYDAENGRFIDDATGKPVSDADFDRLASNRRANPVRETMVRVGDKETGQRLEPAPVGRNTLKTAVLAQTLLRAKPSEVPELLGQLRRIASGELGDSGLSRILPSKRVPDTQTETPAFKKWFGDSKVVNEDGNPLVVYKGMHPFDWRQETDETKGPLIESIDRPSLHPAFNNGEEGVKIAGFFGSKDTANDFAKGSRNSAIYPVYLSFQNPKVIDGKGKKAGVIQFGESGREFRESIRSGKFDSVIIKNTSDEGTIYVALKPAQVKSAIGNNGEFDPNNPSILKSESKESTPAKRLSDAEVKAAKESAEKIVASHWGRGAVSRLKNRGRVEFVTRQEVVDRNIGGHKSVNELDGVDGFYDPDTGKAYVVADSGAKAADMPGVLSHEIFHANGEQFLGSKGFQRLKDAFRKLKSRDKDIEAAYKRVPKDTKAEHVDEEGLAYLAQEAPKHRLVQRLEDEAKLFLNRLGIPLDWLNAHGAAVRKIAALNLKDAGNRGAVARFNKDGRIVPSKRAEDDEKDLIATHNISDAKLIHAIRMGGLPVPSLAVSKANDSITGFGDITLVGSKSLVDPKRGAKTYGADVYSPRYPSVDYKLDNNALKQLNKLLGKHAEENPIYSGEIRSVDDLSGSKQFRAYAEENIGKSGYHDLKPIAEKMLRDAGAQEVMFRGYTNSGTRRYIPHTIENVVKVLKKDIRGGEGYNYGVGSLRSKFTPQFRSIKQIKEQKGRLVGEEAFKAVKEEIDSEFFRIVDDLRPLSGRGNAFDFTDTVLAVMEDAPRYGVKGALEEYGIEDVSDESQRSIAEFLQKLRDLPTGYFESKVPRVVDIGEFSAAVIPDDTSSEVRKALEDRGIPLVEYKSGDVAARREAVERAGKENDLLFSKRSGESETGAEEPTPKFNAATEFWSNNVGKPVFNAISRATKAVVANDFLKRAGLNLAEDMPPEAQKAWRQYKQDVGQLKKTVAEIGEEAKTLSPEERALVSDYVEREMKAGVTPPESVVRMATLMTSIMRKQSQQLVETGMLSKDAADRWEGRYLPRFYQKHLLTNPFDTMLRKAYLSGIKGTHLKGRGLFESIPVKDVPAYEKMGWEVRDPELGKTPDLTKLPEGAKVRVWRDFTPAERQKMGEVRDAMYRFARGYTDTQIDIAKGKLFDHIARTVARDDNPGGSYVLVPDTSVPGTGVKKFGNLAGKYVPGDVLAALKAKAGPDSALTKAYMKALSLWKEGKTSMNPVTHVNNVVSNVVMADLAGVNLVDPRSWKLYADTFRDYSREGKSFKEAQKAGLFGGEWYGNEVAQWLPLPNELQNGANSGNIAGKFAKKIANAMGTGRRAMGNLYQAEDQFFKLLLYKQARERGLNADDAVTWAEKFVFDYSTAAPGVTKLKNTLFPFANYSSKAVPALAFAATHYPWRIAKWIGLLSAFSLYSFGKLYGEDDRDEMADSEAKLLPDYLRGRSSFFGVPKAIRLPYNDENTGDGMYLDISRFLPLGDLFDAENQAGGVPLPAPLTPNNPIITTAIAMLANKDSFTGKDIVRESDTGGEAAQKRLAWLYRQMAPNNPVIPGTYNFNRLGEAASAMKGEPIGPYTGLDYNGNTISPGRAIAQTFGLKLRTVDFDKEMGWQISDLKRELTDLKSQKTKLKRNQSIAEPTLERELEKLDRKIEAVNERLDKLTETRVP